MTRFNVAHDPSFFLYFLYSFLLNFLSLCLSPSVSLSHSTPPTHTRTHPLSLFPSCLHSFLPFVFLFLFTFNPQCRGHGTGRCGHSSWQCTSMSASATISPQLCMFDATPPLSSWSHRVGRRGQEFSICSSSCGITYNMDHSTVIHMVIHMISI